MQYYSFTVFIPTTVQQFDTKYTIIYQASYMFRHFSAILVEVFDKEKHKID
jgi:hypothetical protein